MRHARQLQAQRRGGDIAGPAWPSIVATTTSLTGAAAGIATTLVWSDPLHLRLGVGMAAAGALFSSVAMLAARRDRATRRELVATMREDLAAELRYETTRRDKQISDLKTEALAAEETVVLFEERAKEEQLRADASEAARVRAEHDLAVLSAWVQQTTAAAELTRSAVQSIAQVQPFEPAQQFEPVSVHDHAFASYQAARSGGYAVGYDPAYAPEPGYEMAPAYGAEYGVYAEYAEYTEYAEYAEFTDNTEYRGYTEYAGYGTTTNAVTATGAEIDLRPAAAVPVRAQEPQLPPELPSAEPRLLRSAVLAVRDEVGFDVAEEVAGPARDPYTVPGVVMPRQREDGRTPALPPARPVPPERLYRPYLATGQGTTSNAAPVDLTMYDETQQMARIEHRQTGTA